MKVERRGEVESARSTILECAERLFLERGYAGTSMSEIAKASGVAKSLIHHHFGTKEALWTAVKQSCFAAYYAKQKELLSVEPLTLENAKVSMRMYFEFLAEHPRVLRLMWWMLLSGDDDRSNALVAELGDLGVAQIEAMQERGALRRDLRPESILAGFLGLIHSAFTEGWVLTDRGVSLQTYVAEAWEMFAHGVMADPG
ncbi:MAG: TetR/AcrR family transcriptional regulator [Nannocystaceae bacterium]|nr:TetR/AcrR family transcriptional regulator [bacterium]